MMQVSRLQATSPDWSAAQFDATMRSPHGAPALAGARASNSHAILAADVMALTAAFAAAVLVAPQYAFGPLFVETSQATRAIHFALFTALVAAAATVLVFIGNNHYTRRVPFWTELRDLVIASGVSLLFCGCTAFLLQQQGVRSIPLTIWIAFPLLSIALRTIARWQLAVAGHWQLRTVIIGAPDCAAETLGALQTERQLGYHVVAVVHPDKLSALPTQWHWRLLVEHYRADLVVLSYNGTSGPSRDTLESLLRDRVPFALMPQMEGLPVLGFEQTRFFSHDTVMFTFRNNLAKPMARFTKIAFDLAAATAGLIVLAPVLGIIAALVRLDGGPALYSHPRIGRGGRPFGCLKFRSMVVDSEAALRTLLAQDPAAAAEWLQTRKLRDDPRITRIGRLLRKTSLDELPQLFNVLLLQMSLVGPRPIVGAEVARFGEDIAYYYETRPGLTGLWQVSGRTETSYAKRVQLDTWYVKNWTLWHDIAILAKTIPAVLQRRGAV